MHVRIRTAAIPVYLAFMLFTSGDVFARGRLISWGTLPPLSGDQWSMEMDSVSAGLSHSLALTVDGDVIAWGDNTYGQSTVPDNLGHNIVRIAAGGMHNLALNGAGRVIAWGHNGEGQCNVPGGALQKIVSISAGLMHSMALTHSRRVLVWGDNQFGQCYVPGGLNNVAAISAGGMHSVALRAGIIYCWGDNSFNQLRVPEAAAGNSTAISAGYYHTLALTMDGAVVAWGDNSFGQCDVPETARSGVVKISAGETHSMALKEDGTLITWGGQTPGQPMAASPGRAIRLQDIAAGSTHSLGLMSSTLISAGDGIPDWWKINHGFDPLVSLNPAQDTDGDGVPDAAEYLAGTDPHDAQSAFRLIMAPTESGMDIRYGPVSKDRNYILERAINLSGNDWMPVETPGAPGIMNVGPPDAAAGIYRIRIHLR